jgi:drug/metabolite transporter superfamily protein YnfA
MASGTGALGAAVVFVAAAVLEVAGDAVIRRGLRGSGALTVVLGFAILGSYGVVVNLLKIDFSRLLGAYVGAFAVVSVVAGRAVFEERVPPSTWVGLLVVVAGSAIIHLGGVAE